MLELNYTQRSKALGKNRAGKEERVKGTFQRGYTQRLLSRQRCLTSSDGSRKIPFSWGLFL
jgi:hypothetical protein